MILNATKNLPGQHFDMIWCSHYVPIQLKLGLFKTTCLPVLLYGSGIWVFKKNIISKSNAFSTSCYRIMLGIKRLYKVSNERIYVLTSTSPLMATVKSRQLKFLDHILRMDKNEPVKTYTLYELPHVRRLPGSQRRSFSRQAED